MPQGHRASVKPTTTSLKPATGAVTLLIGTRKGAFLLRGDRARRTWKLSAPILLGHIVHHLVMDPRDRLTMLIACRTGHLGPTVFRSTDFGKTFATLVRGLDVVEGFDAANIAVHDPHCVRLCPSNPDRLYQQNHCGIYRIDRPSNEWVRIGKNMPKQIGDIGFSIVLHPRNPDTVWVFPMDGSTVWPRVSPGGKPAVYVTKNGGKSWARQDKGFPRSDAWWTVKRQAMTADAHEPVGLYFGTTSGEVWASRTGGASWAGLAPPPPANYSVGAAGPSPRPRSSRRRCPPRRTRRARRMLRALRSE